MGTKGWGRKGLTWGWPGLRIVGGVIAVGRVGGLVLAVALSIPGAAQVVINEVAWGGTEASPYGEWIELYNASDEPVDVSGWALVWEGVTIPLGEESGGTFVLRSHVIEPHGFFLLERGRDDTVVGRQADIIYRGALSDRGETLRLLNPWGEVVSTANLGCEGGWWAGEAGASMERVSPAAPDDRFSWRTGIPGGFLDAAGAVIRGSPGEPNACWLSSPRILMSLPPGPLTGVISWAWQAQDPDTPAEDLVVSLNVSYDQGVTLQPVVEGLPASGSFDWDTSGWPPGEVLLVARAEDPDGFWGVAVLAAELGG
ncbi:MAG: hypothetical protein XD60_0487 [Acetothermia bacterium 64_32]|nr:MAG: hypothetical protein XD60_0487 [Acetothermia bacterium 64_32]